MHLVVAYDVIEDRRRVRLARFLMGFLDRVQKSVFEGKMEEKRLGAMKSGIEKIIDQDEDNVRIYDLCARCAPAVVVMGTAVVVEEPDQDVIV